MNLVVAVMQGETLGEKSHKLSLQRDKGIRLTRQRDRSGELVVFLSKLTLNLLDKVRSRQLARRLSRDLVDLLGVKLDKVFDHAFGVGDIEGIWWIGIGVVQEGHASPVVDPTHFELDLRWGMQLQFTLVHKGRSLHLGGIAVREM